MVLGLVSKKIQLLVISLHPWACCTHGKNACAKDNIKDHLMVTPSALRASLSVMQGKRVGGTIDMLDFTFFI